LPSAWFWPIGLGAAKAETISRVAAGAGDRQKLASSPCGGRFGPSSLEKGRRRTAKKILFFLPAYLDSSTGSDYNIRRTEMMRASEEDSQLSGERRYGDVPTPAGRPPAVFSPTRRT
jgi:hypothetical protein